MRLLNRWVFGDENVQQTASGIRASGRTLSPLLRSPDKTVQIVRKPVEGDLTLLAREARYATLPPKPCTGDGDTATCFYEWFGQAFEVFPPLGTKAIAYDGSENTADPLATPPKLTDTFYRIHREHDAWILDPPPSGGSTIDLCLVHAPFNGGTIWGSGQFIRVVHMKPSGSSYISAEAAPLGYSIVKTWPGTVEADWRWFQSTQGTAPNFTPQSSSVYCATKTWKGVEYITPEFFIDAGAPNPALPAGDC